MLRMAAPQGAGKQPSGRPSTSPYVGAGWRYGQPNEAQRENWGGTSYNQVEQTLLPEDSHSRKPARRKHRKATVDRQVMRQLARSEQGRHLREGNRKVITLSEERRANKSYLEEASFAMRARNAASISSQRALPGKPNARLRSSASTAGRGGSSLQLLEKATRERLQKNPRPVSVSFDVPSTSPSDLSAFRTAMHDVQTASVAARVTASTGGFLDDGVMPGFWADDDSMPALSSRAGTPMSSSVRRRPSSRELSSRRSILNHGSGRGTASAEPSSSQRRRDSVSGRILQPLLMSAPASRPSSRDSTFSTGSRPASRDSMTGGGSFSRPTSRERFGSPGGSRFDEGDTRDGGLRWVPSRSREPVQLNWAAMRPYELKKHCRGRGLAEHGTKETLIARLEGREKPPTPPSPEERTVDNDPELAARAVGLKEAAKAGDVGKIRSLLLLGVPVDVVDEQGYTPLYCATMYEKEEAVAVLLWEGAAVDKQNNNGVSPLMAAARDGYTKIVTRLLEAGADHTQVDEFGRTCETIAAEKDHPETVAAVQEWSASHPVPTKPDPAAAAVAAAADQAAEPRVGSRLSSRGSGGDGGSSRPSSRDTTSPTIVRRRQSSAKPPCTGQQGRSRGSKSRAGTPHGTALDFGGGVAARMDFFKLFKEEAELTAAEGADAPLLDSARRRYLSACDIAATKGVVPMPLLIGKSPDDSAAESSGRGGGGGGASLGVAGSGGDGGGEAAGQRVNLSSYQLGDEATVAYAKGLGRLKSQGVALLELVLADCALGGRLRPDGRPDARGVCSLAEAVGESLPSLQLLDLSGNRIAKEGATALAACLKEHPRLQTCVLERNRLGDKCATLLLDSCVVHRTLTHLDLSDNMLGDTPGGAFGEALQSFLEVNESVVHLDLSYNRLGANRGTADMLAQGLGVNPTLRFLDLSLNALRDRGACALGKALRSTKGGLVELNLRENSVGEKGAMVLADALRENVVLEQLTLDDNPVGPRGGRALFRAFKYLVSQHSDMQLDIKGCNFELRDRSPSPLLSPHGGELFDRDEPGGTWTCDLALPYERMVANELVDLAWVEEGENWKDETMDGKPFELPEPPPGTTWTRADYMLPEEGQMRVTYMSTKRVAKLADAMDDATLEALFILLERFSEEPRRPVLLVQLHPEIEGAACHEEAVLREHFGQFGQVTLIEFVSWEDGAGWVPCPHTAPTAPTAPDANNGDGRKGAAAAAYVHFANAAQAEKVVRMIDGDGDGELDKAGAMCYGVDLQPVFAGELSTSPEKMAALLRLVASDSFFTARQVSLLMEKFIDDTWRVEALTFLTPRIVDMENYNHEVCDFLDEDSFRLLESRLGPMLFYFNPGNPTGHYKINLHNRAQRLILIKLVEISIEERTQRRFDADGDGQIDRLNTSQKGDWDNWRNERIDYFDGEGMRPYDFDEKRPWDLPHDGLIECDYVSTNCEFRRHPTRYPACDADTFEQLMAQLRAIGTSVITVGAVTRAAGRRGAGFRRASVSVMAAARTGHMDASEEERHQRRVAMRPPWQVPAQNLRVFCQTKEEQAGLVGTRLMHMLRRACFEMYFSAAQAEQIVSIMPQKVAVEAMVVLFSRITDPENQAVHTFFAAMGHTSGHSEHHTGRSALRARHPGGGGAARPGSSREGEEGEEEAADEAASMLQEYTHRIGAANLFNPFRLNEAKFCLNLKCPDERAVAAMLVELTAEPGENWINEEYNGLPFEMGAAWLEAPPDRGILTLTFHTGKGTADLFLRSRLAARLLMPGPGRWRAIKPEFRQAGQDGAEVDRVLHEESSV